ncbi:MAG: FecR domain-containing protein, partial [Bacteroidota bacterium]
MQQRYKTYTAEELALEPEFIRWVREEDPALAASWSAWLVANPDRAPVVEEAKELVNAMQGLAVSFPASRKQALWNAIDTATPAEETPIRSISGSPKRKWWTIAAGIGMLILAGWVAYHFGQGDQMVTQMVAVGEKLEEELPDGSVVYANAVTTLSYSPQEWSSARDVQLKGEAFFEVEKGSNFTVNTPQGTVEVLGTSFNVLAREDIFEVICYTGKVRVTAGERTAELSPGQSV